MTRKSFLLMGAFAGVSALAAPKKYTEAEMILQVRKVIAKQLEIDLAKVLEDSDFAKDLGADSLDVVECVMALEEAFEIDVPDDDMEKVKKVHEAIACVKKHLLAQKRLEITRK